MIDEMMSNNMMENVSKLTFSKNRLFEMWVFMSGGRKVKMAYGDFFLPRFVTDMAMSLDLNMKVCWPLFETNMIPMPKVRILQEKFMEIRSMVAMKSYQHFPYKKVMTVEELMKECDIESMKYMVLDESTVSAA